MTIQLNRMQKCAPKLRNTCERRHDLTESILQNINRAAARDEYAPVYHTLPLYDSTAAPQPFPVETFAPALDTPAPLATYEAATIIEAAAALESRPQPGVWRTDRGTIDLVMHPTGTFIKPRYNYSGILLSVELEDGSKFIRQNANAPWMVLGPDGSQVIELRITSLTVDRAGNLIYVTTDGVRTVIQYDGMIQTTKVS